MSALAMAIFLAGQTAGAGPAPPPAFAAVPVPAVRARINLASYFTADDYPAAALRAEAEGSVFFRLDIAPDGRVSACTVTASSGSAALDNAACRILRSRVRAIPARNAGGNAVADVISSSIRFILPELAPERAGIPVPAIRATPRAPLPSYVSARDYPRAARAAGIEGIAYVRLVIGTDGRVRACAIAQTSGSAALDAAACRLLTGRARFTPARDGGAPACDVAEGAILWQLPPGRRFARRSDAAAGVDGPRPAAPVDASAFGCPGV
jgi:TonB family protein